MNGLGGPLEGLGGVVEVMEGLGALSCLARGWTSLEGQGCRRVAALAARMCAREGSRPPSARTASACSSGGSNAKPGAPRRRIDSGLLRDRPTN